MNVTITKVSWQRTERQNTAEEQSRVSPVALAIAFLDVGIARNCLYMGVFVILHGPTPIGCTAAVMDLSFIIYNGHALTKVLKWHDRPELDPSCIR